MKIVIDTELRIMDGKGEAIVWDWHSTQLNDDSSWRIGKLPRGKQMILSRGLVIKFAKELQQIGFDLGVIGSSMDSAAQICVAIKNGDTTWESEED